MTERRAHWSDDLVEAVAAVINQADVDDYANVHFTHSDIYALIAAVEDWELGFHAQTEGVTHSAECWRWHHECARTLIEQQQAAIQRVQAVCDKPNGGPSWDSYVEGYNDAISVVQAAMEGDVDA